MAAGLIICSSAPVIGVVRITESLGMLGNER